MKRRRGWRRGGFSTCRVQVSTRQSELCHLASTPPAGRRRLWHGTSVRARAEHSDWGVNSGYLRRSEEMHWLQHLLTGVQTGVQRGDRRRVKRNPRRRVKSVSLGRCAGFADTVRAMQQSPLKDGVRQPRIVCDQEAAGRHCLLGPGSLRGLPEVRFVVRTRR